MSLSEDEVHEARNLLNTMRLHVAMLKKRLASADEPTVRRHLDKLDGGIDRMEVLVSRSSGKPEALLHAVAD